MNHYIYHSIMSHVYKLDLVQKHLGDVDLWKRSLVLNLIVIVWKDLYKKLASKFIVNALGLVLNIVNMKDYMLCISVVENRTTRMPFVRTTNFLTRKKN